MADGRARRRPTLFAQIATRLAALAVLFAVLNGGIVILDYVGDKEIMAEDFVGQQAGRVEHLWREQRAGTGGPARQELLRPQGASAWGYLVFDPSGRPTITGGDPAMTAAAPRPEPGMLDWTRRDATPAGVRITGIHRYDGPAGPHWVLIIATVQDWRIYLPVISEELLDHVAIPLAPLTLLLLLFSIGMVRRTLAPLTAAVAEVDALDPGDLSARLSEPAASREVTALVAAVNRALERLHKAMQLLKDFTADAAHELRTPLSVLQLRIETLPEGETRRRLTEDVQAMTRLVNQMLELSQAEALSMEGAVDVDLLRLAQEIVMQLAPLAFAAGHDIRLVDRNPRPLHGHPDALGRALRNLIENAIAHAGEAGPIEVVVGPGARFSVRDHGVGLAPGDADLLFRRFWRKQRNARDGAGLGLGITRSIVEAHGGTISARNARNGGAIFCCDFPDAGTPSGGGNPA